MVELYQGDGKMGYGHISPEVKEQLINKVGSLFLATGESSRNLSKILLQDYNIKLSHVTVLNYIKLFLHKKLVKCSVRHIHVGF